VRYKSFRSRRAALPQKALWVVAKTKRRYGKREISVNSCPEGFGIDIGKGVPTSPGLF